MSLDSTLRGLAAEIGKNRNPTGSVAAPAKLRHRTGTIDAYTAGALTASVQIGADVVDAPFLATYTPTAGDAVSVLINNGSPLILGAVNKLPAAGSGVVGRAEFYDSGDRVTIGGLLAASNGPLIAGDTFGDTSSIQYNASTENVDFVADGWYQAELIVSIDSATAGDRLSALIQPGSDDTRFTYGPAGPAGTASICVTTVPLWRAAGGGMHFGIANDFARGTIGGAKFSIVRLAG